MPTAGEPPRRLQCIIFDGKCGPHAKRIITASEMLRRIAQGRTLASVRCRRAWSGHAAMRSGQLLGLLPARPGAHQPELEARALIVARDGAFTSTPVFGPMALS